MLLTRYTKVVPWKLPVATIAADCYTLLKTPRNMGERWKYFDYCQKLPPLSWPVTDPLNRVVWGKVKQQEWVMGGSMNAVIHRQVDKLVNRLMNVEKCGSKFWISHPKYICIIVYNAIIWSKVRICRMQQETMPSSNTGSILKLVKFTNVMK